MGVLHRTRPDGEIQKYKAPRRRAGLHTNEGVDEYNEMVKPFAKFASLRAILTLAAEQFNRLTLTGSSTKRFSWNLPLGLKSLKRWSCAVGPAPRKKLYCMAPNVYAPRPITWSSLGTRGDKPPSKLSVVS
jgi:hypothetical protein